MERRELAVPGSQAMAEMARLPMAAFSYGMEWMFRALQSVQPAGARERPAVAWPSGAAAMVQRVSQSEPRKEGPVMNDQDLGGNDLKYVRYAFVFTKADMATALGEPGVELVDYPTTPGSFGGRKLRELLNDLQAGKVKRPRIWEENQYPPGGGPLPSEDEKYVHFVYKVDWRLEREEANYPRENVKVMRGIRSEIGGLRAEFGDLSAKIG